jgi:CHAT domain-containing protein/large exoprotein involved in heme utilization and adhesion
LDQGAILSTSTSGGGDAGQIRIATATLNLLNGGEINSFSEGSGQGGQITIHATEAVNLGEGVQNFAPVISVETSNAGQAGDILINTPRFTLSETARITATATATATNQQGGGSIRLNANQMDLAGIVGVFAETQGQAPAGTLTLQSFDQSLGQGPAQLDPSLALALAAGAEISASTSGRGNGGDLILRAPQAITISGQGKLAVEAESSGNAGNITVTTQDFTLADGVELSASTSGSGNAGNINLNLQTLTLQSGATISSTTTGDGNAGSIDLNASQSVTLGQDTRLLVETSAAGNPGNITLTTPSLILSEDAQLSATITPASTNQSGGGNITLNSSNLDISGRLGVFAETASTAPAGNLTLRPNSTNTDLNIFFRNDGFISASTSATGPGGNITLTAPETIDIAGQGNINVTTSGSGNAGNISVTASDISLRDGVTLSGSTSGSGQGGNLTLTAQNLSLSNGASIQTNTSGSGNAGTIKLDVANNLTLDNASIQASTTNTSTGQGGNIDIDPIITRLRNSNITVNSQGQGIGGNLSLISGNLFLEQASSLSATTASTDGGNINLQIDNQLVLREGSQITTTAGTAGAGGDGGNITITADFITALPGSNSDIVANAFEGSGGNINLTTNGLFGFAIENTDTPRSDLRNNITASSQFGSSGTISATGNIDPSQGLAALPGLRDISNQIGGMCNLADHQSHFFVAGRGGIPADPRQFLRQQNTLQDFRVAQASADGTLVAAKQETKNNTLNVLLAKGKTHYDAGQWQQALELWQQALTLAQNQNQPHTQITSHHYLAILHQTLGQWQTATTHLNQAQTLLATNPDPFLQAQLQNTQANLLFQTGQFETAFNHWQQTETHYQALGDRHGILLSQINQAQTLQSLGFHHRAHTQLEQIYDQLTMLEDAQLQGSLLQSLSIALQNSGQLDTAQTLLETGLSLNLNPTHQSQLLLHLGNTARLQQNHSQALQLYQQATAQAHDPTIQLQAHLNHLSLLVEQQAFTQAMALVPAIQTQLTTRPPSHTQLYQQINFAESLLKLYSSATSESLNPTLPTIDNIIQTLTTTAHQAQTLQDPQTHTYVLGQLAQAHSQQHQWPQAQHFSQQALTLAQQHQLPSAAYQWSWQLGQILQQQHRTDQALDAYRQAIAHLSTIRQDLVVASSDRQFSFRDQVEPLYRQLVGLLLQPGLDQAIPQAHLTEARELIEDLQLAELNDYFQDACTTATPIVADDIDPTAAVVYPILLDDRLDVIVSIANQPLIHHSIAITPDQVQRHSHQLLRSLTSPFRSSQIQTLQGLQAVYNWLIAPIEASLAQAEIETLAFVADGPLRTLPLTALHDGERYLIETYNVALSPGLELLDPQSLPQQDLHLLAGGLSKARDSFAPLPYVEPEIEHITQFMPNHRTYLNQQLTSLNLQADTDPSTLIHLATHGKFGSNAEDTFILLWDQRLNMSDFSALLQTKSRDQDPVELLVLSACKTAMGDSRSVLGIAGMAVRSNTRSVLAGLWPLNDQATSVFMPYFYGALAQPGVTKSQAMRQALLALMADRRFEAPFYWSPYVLVGNWL